MSKRKASRMFDAAVAKETRRRAAIPKGKETDPDWEHVCELCGARPIIPITGMCGPCTFGEAETAGGNW